MLLLRSRVWSGSVQRSTACLLCKERKQYFTFYKVFRRAIFRLLLFKPNCSRHTHKSGSIEFRISCWLSLFHIPILVFGKIMLVEKCIDVFFCIWWNVGYRCSKQENRMCRIALTVWCSNAGARSKKSASAYVHTAFFPALEQLNRARVALSATFAMVRFKIIPV